ncbi:MAG TPA: hypothetical protein PLA13_07075 [Microbacteriaceae bacterium]|jgi:hypothetical protein|nr:hypothetical protein [Microbacteriaceae bacterium]HQX36104.1 hypothetical protein [Microbacteriaceae bacterium]HQZ47898.1 hypothetical protein [Microbacteriaceae bacterium]HRA09942.1 hypothetical protein [Microbacteriaceae bacterium]
MSSVGKRPSRAVYRRRRLVLLVGIVVVAALIVWLFVAQPWAGASGGAGASAEKPAASDAPSDAPSDPDAAATPPAEGDAEAEPDPDAPEVTPTGPAECVAADVLVEAVTDKVTYAAGEQPQLAIQLTNRGKDCTLNVGTTQQKLTVMSGGDTWWRSTDCQSEPSDMVVLIEAGQTVKSGAPVVWDRTRSTPSSCDNPNRPVAAGGGASYHVSVEIGGIPSQSTQQILLYG